MTTSIDHCRGRAKQLVRWHRERDRSVAGQIRLLARHAHLTDEQALDMPMPLALAQEIVAVGMGHADWPALKAALRDAPAPGVVSPPAPALHAAVPVLFVRDVAAAARFYEERLGFATDFLHGRPAFYGSVSCGAPRLHLRHVGCPNFVALAASEKGLIVALIAVSQVKALFGRFVAAGVTIAQPLTRHPWGGLDFHVADPDGNVIGFVEYRDDPADAGR